MDASDYELAPLGHYWGKTGFFCFGLIFIIALGGLLVVSTFTHDMYVSKYQAYHHCIKALNTMDPDSPMPVDEGHIWDPVTETTEQNFFFDPQLCDAMNSPRAEDKGEAVQYLWTDAVEGLEPRNQNLFIYAYIKQDPN